jgi:hypothetical protein
MAVGQPSRGFLHNQGIHVSTLLMVAGMATGGLAAITLLAAAVPFLAGRWPIRQLQYSVLDVALGVSCLVGLVTYYAVCRRTEAARRLGLTFGYLFVILNGLLLVSGSLSGSEWTAAVGLVAGTVLALYVDSQNRSLLRALVFLINLRLR